MTSDPLDRIRDQLMGGVAEESIRRRRRRHRLAGALAAVLIGVVTVSMAVVRDRDGHQPVISTDQPDDSDASSTPVADPTIWTLAQPPGWDRAGRELVPALGWDSLTLATFELHAGGQQCAQLPEQALRELGSQDALASVFFDVGPADGLPDAHEMLASGSLPAFEQHQAGECADRDDLRIHWGEVQRAGIAMYVLVAFGPDVPETTTESMWAALASLQPRDTPSRADAPRCVVTVPGAAQERVVASVSGPQPPDGEAFYGRRGLWTALPVDGIYQRRKSVWWSEHFEGGAAEPEPDLAVNWTRLDQQVEPIHAPAPGTNARTADQGSFMINGIDPPTPGCWEVSATYLGGNDLSYVYWYWLPETETAEVDECVVDGPAEVTVPDVIGVSLDDAIDELVADRLHVVGTGTPDGDPVGPRAIVVATEPGPGIEVPQGACVGLRTEELGTPQDLEVAGSFLRFAADPTPANAEALPLADMVQLGLGDQLLTERSAPSLHSPEAWLLDETDFHGYTGPFSALTTAADAGDTTVRVGSHRRCAGQPAPPPDQVAELRRVSVQPDPVPDNTCLRWWSIDLYLDDNGRIAAVSLDLWEP